MSSLSSIADLKLFKSMWKIKVKIIRLWRQYSAAVGLTIEMVLIDSNGDKIHASVKKDLVNQFDTFLNEGDSRLLINFSVSHSTGSYRTTRHAYKIGFLSTTRVRQCEGLPAELNGFEPINYKDLIDGNLNADYLIDVIGQIVEVSHVEGVSVNGKETQKISMELRNSEDERLPLVLWGGFATDNNNAVQVHEEQSLVVVLRFGKIKVWKEKGSVSNAYNVSTVSINPPMVEVETFVNTLPNDELALAIVEAKPTSVVNGVSDKDDFFVHTPRKTVAAVLGSNQGLTIQATMFPEIGLKMFTTLTEGDWFAIDNFKITHALGRIQTSRNRYHIDFTKVTQISKIGPVNEDTFFRFAKYQDILCGLCHPMFAIDVYGALVDVGNFQVVENDPHGEVYGEKNRRLQFRLKDIEENELDCVAYGDLAEELDNFWWSSDANTILCVLKSWTIEREGGFRHISNIEGCSKILFDPENPEIQAFRMMFPLNADLLLG